MGVATQVTQPQQSSTTLSSMASPLPPVLGKPRLDQAQAIYGRLRSIAHYCEAIHGRPPELAAQVARVCMCIYMQWKKKKNIDSRIVEGKWSGQCRGMAALPLFLRRSIPSCARTWLCRYINPLFLIFLVSCGFEVIMVWYGWLGNVWIGGLIGLSFFVWSGW